MRKEPHKSAPEMLGQYLPSQTPATAPAQLRHTHGRGVMKVILIAVALGVLTNAACRMTFDIGHLRETSMLPTIEPGDFLVSQQWGRSPKTGSIVLILKDENPNELTVKRIIGQPGDQVRIPDTGSLHTLLEDEYWVTGDNAFESLDSRAFGPVRRHEIQGIIVFRTGKLRWIWD